MTAISLLQLCAHGLAAFFRSKFGHGLEIAQALCERSPVLERPFDRCFLLQDDICFVFIVPEPDGFREAGKFGNFASLAGVSKMPPQESRSCS